MSGGDNKGHRDYLFWELSLYGTSFLISTLVSWAALLHLFMLQVHFAAVWWDLPKCRENIWCDSVWDIVAPQNNSVLHDWEASQSANVRNYPTKIYYVATCSEFYFAKQI